MDTVTEKPAQEEGLRPYLLARPQPLGILPSWWFWNDRNNWRLVRWPFAVLVFVSLLALAALPFSPVLEFSALIGTYCLGLGLLEKYVRQQALKGRALHEADLEELPEGRD